ncbi:hypothetical protein FQZ97_746290 [compost metagenome]
MVCDSLGLDVLHDAAPPKVHVEISFPFSTTVGVGHRLLVSGPPQANGWRNPPATGNHRNRYDNRTFHSPARQDQLRRRGHRGEQSRQHVRACPCPRRRSGDLRQTPRHLQDHGRCAVHSEQWPAGGQQRLQHEQLPLPRQIHPLAFRRGTSRDRHPGHESLRYSVPGGRHRSRRCPAWRHANAGQEQPAGREASSEQAGGRRHRPAPGPVLRRHRKQPGQLGTHRTVSARGPPAVRRRRTERHHQLLRPLRLPRSGRGRLFPQRARQQLRQCAEQCGAFVRPVSRQCRGSTGSHGRHGFCEGLCRRYRDHQRWVGFRAARPGHWTGRDRHPAPGRAKPKPNQIRVAPFPGNQPRHPYPLPGVRSLRLQPGRGGSPAFCQ